MSKPEGALVYPLVRDDVEDFEEYARTWCAERGWTFVKVESQRSVNGRYYQLTVRVEPKAVAS